MVQRQYTQAVGRNPGEDQGHSHLYLKGKGGAYKPMCPYGWNRSGTGFSIFRGHAGARGLCKICMKRVASNLPPAEPKARKTKWI